jgi:hypothetical protein
VPERRLACLTAAIGAAILVCVSTPAVAHAGTVDVVVDDTDVTLAPTEDDGWDGKIAVTNVSDSIAVLEARVEGNAGCIVRPKPKSVESGRRADVTLTIAPGCDVGTGVDVGLTFDGLTPAAGYVLAAAPARQSTPDWGVIPWSFLTCILLALGVVFAAWSRVGRKLNAPKFGSELAVDAAWSFSDNWVSTITVATTALVALFGASDTVPALVGSNADDAVAVAAVAAAVAALLVALAPLLLKGLATDTGKPTIGGTFVAAVFTLVAAFGLTAALTWQIAAASSGAIRWSTVGLGALTGAAVALYGVVSLSALLWTTGPVVGAALNAPSRYQLGKSMGNALL